MSTVWGAEAARVCLPGNSSRPVGTSGSCGRVSAAAMVEEPAGRRVSDQKGAGHAAQHGSRSFCRGVASSPAWPGSTKTRWPVCTPPKSPGAARSRRSTTPRPQYRQPVVPGHHGSGAAVLRHRGPQPAALGRGAGGDVLERRLRRLDRRRRGLAQMAVWTKGLMSAAEDKNEAATQILSYAQYFGWLGMGVGIAARSSHRARRDAQRGAAPVVRDHHQAPCPPGRGCGAGAP